MKTITTSELTIATVAGKNFVNIKFENELWISTKRTTEKTTTKFKRLEKRHWPEDVDMKTTSSWKDKLTTFLAPENQVEEFSKTSIGP